MTSEPDIEPIALEQHKEPPKEASRAFFTLRTLLGSLIYGGVGWGIGYGFGSLGERGEQNRLGRTVIPWVFGIGAAILAAYTSTKIAREENGGEKTPAKSSQGLLEAALEKPVAPIEHLPPATEKPGSAIVAAEHAGVVESLDQKRAV